MYILLGRKWVRQDSSVGENVIELILYTYHICHVSHNIFNRLRFGTLEPIFFNRLLGNQFLPPAP